MSGTIDELDKKFVQLLFPRYLREQPISYYLWMLYMDKRSIFRSKNLIDSNNNFSQDDGLSKSISQQLEEPVNSNLSGRLTYEVKKDIWRRLNQLNVTGTLSFDSINDMYLIEVYKYFFPGSFNDTFDLTGNEYQLASPFRRKPKGLNEASITSRVRNELDAEIESDFSMFDENDEDEEEEGVEDDEEDDDEDEDDTDNATTTEHNDSTDPRSNAFFNVLPNHNNNNQADVIHYGNGDINDNDELEQSPSKSREISKSVIPPDEPSVDMHYSSSSKDEILKRPRDNPYPQLFYSKLGFFLPFKWVLPPSDRINISDDGFNNLSVLPNLQSYISDKTPTSPNSSINRLKNNSKNEDFSATWANHFIPANKIGIYYYEVQILNSNNVTTLQSSNIVVGFKYWGVKVGDESIERKSNTDILSSNDGLRTQTNTGRLGNSTTTSNIIPTIQRRRSSFLEPELIREVVNDNVEVETKTDLDEDFMGYSGIDGNVVSGAEHKNYATPFGHGDVIGCGINYVNGTIFFTKNGIMLGTAFNECHDCNFIPYIALKPYHSVKTNFGLFEEFVFDIDKYLTEWKSKCYENIFGSLDTPDVLTEYGSILPTKNDSNSDMEDDNVDIVDADMKNEESLSEKEGSNNISNGKNDEYGSGTPIKRNGKSFSGLFDDSDEESMEYLAKEFRYDENLKKLIKPDDPLINKLNSKDGSLNASLNTMINEYLIHEGLIDVAKGFLSDLKSDCIDIGDNSKELDVIAYNERQIIGEEKNLRVRQELRRLISERNVSKCIECIDTNLPELLNNDIELFFELKKAQYILMIKGIKEKLYSIEQVIEEGQKLTKQFIYPDNDMIQNEEIKEKFKEEINNISSLLAYEDPLKEAPEELAIYLLPDYVHERLFQIINNRILKYLQKNDESKLENVVNYTRGMVLTLLGNNCKGVVDENGNEFKYYKLINLDDDFLRC